MYSKILIPVDGKEGAWRAIRAAHQAADLCTPDAEIVLLHVEPAISQLITGDDRVELKKKHLADGEERLKPVDDFLNSRNIKHRLVVTHGNIAPSIIRVAHDESADVVVMFTDGVEGISDVVFGSITEQVLKEIDIDLLSVRK